LTGIFEVTALVGNVALFDNSPLIHAHATLSDEQMNAVGGHVVSARVSATLEVFLTIYDVELLKQFDENIGLKLWEF